MFLATFQNDRDGFGRAVHGEVAGYLVSTFDRLGPGTFEFDRGKLFRIEIVRLAKMFITGFVGCVHTVDVDCQLERTLGGVVPGQVKTFPTRH